MERKGETGTDVLLSKHKMTDLERVSKIQKLDLGHGRLDAHLKGWREGWMDGWMDDVDDWQGCHLKTDER